MAWIDGVEPMGQNGDGLELSLQGMAVGTDVNAIGQPADYEHMGTLFLQPLNETAHKVLSVGCAAACADDVDDARLVEIGCSFVIEHHRRIGTIGQTAGIEGIEQCQCLDVVTRYKLHLGCRTLQCLVPVFQCINQPWRAVTHHLAYVGPVLIDCLPAAQGAIEEQGSLAVEPGETGQGNGMEYFLIGHGSMYLLNAWL